MSDDPIGDAIESELDAEAWEDSLQGEYPYDADEDRAQMAEITYGSDQTIGQGERTRTGRESNIHWSAVKIIRPDGSVSVGALGHDVDAIRTFLFEESDGGLDELQRPTPAGRLTQDERERRDKIATLVVKARDQGATLEAIGTVLQRPPKTILTLEVRGRALSA